MRRRNYDIRFKSMDLISSSKNWYRAITSQSFMIKLIILTRLMKRSKQNMIRSTS